MRRVGKLHLIQFTQQNMRHLVTTFLFVRIESLIHRKQHHVESNFHSLVNKKSYVEDFALS